MKRSGLILVVLLFGCSGGSGFRDLGPGDVESLPPGTAQGTEWSGQYTLTVSVQDRDCDSVNIVTYPTSATVTQNDGTLTVDLSFASVTHLAGTANQDGSFRVGGKASHSGGVTEYALVEGRMSADFAIDATLYLTFVSASQHCHGKGKVTGKRK